MNLRNTVRERGESPRFAKGLFFPPAPLGVLFASSPQTDPDRLKRCQLEEYV